jgi:hypothetical protein
MYSSNLNVMSKRWHKDYWNITLSAEEIDFSKPNTKDTNVFFGESFFDYNANYNKYILKGDDIPEWTNASDLVSDRDYRNFIRPGEHFLKRYGKNPFFSSENMSGGYYLERQREEDQMDAYMRTILANPKLLKSQAQWMQKYNDTML